MFLQDGYPIHHSPYPCTCSWLTTTSHGHNTWHKENHVSKLTPSRPRRRNTQAQYCLKSTHTSLITTTYSIMEIGCSFLPPIYIMLSNHKVHWHSIKNRSLKIIIHFWSLQSIMIKSRLRRFLVCKALICLELGFPNIAKGILIQFLFFTLFTLLQSRLTMRCHITQLLVI